MRHSVKLIKEPPKPLIGASFEELLSHCRGEHPAAWQQLMDGGNDEDEVEDVAPAS
jgi:hypothetical protein